MTATNPLPRMYTLPEVADIARAPLSTVHAWCFDGKLPSSKVGKRRLVAEPDLRRFLGLDAAGSAGGAS